MNWRRFIKLLGVVVLLGEFLLLAATFYAAYFSPEKEVIVDVDYYGEAEFEFFLIPIIFIIGLLAVIFIFADEFHKFKKDLENGKTNF